MAVCYEQAAINPSAETVGFSANPVARFLCVESPMKLGKPTFATF
jgi:hypothetical protein